MGVANPEPVVNPLTSASMPSDRATYMASVVGGYAGAGDKDDVSVTAMSEVRGGASDAGGFADTL